MKVEIFKKNIKNLKRKPNLDDYNKIKKTFSYKHLDDEIEYVDGKLNAAFNAIDRNAQNWRKNKIALYWEGDDNDTVRYTFSDLHKRSNQFSNLLHSFEIDIADRVFFFLPRVPELYFSFLGALKRGAIAGTMFSAFGPQAIEDRLGNSDAKLLVTNKELLPRVLKVTKNLSQLKIILITDSTQERNEGQVKLYSLLKLLDKEKESYETRMMNPEDPAFMLYTSGTTGKPKGVIHAHRSILHEHMSAKFVLDLKEDDVYWCTADPGWVTGIAYEILGSWSNGASSLVYAGRFSPEKWYEMIDKYQVNVWYTAPTAIRMLAAAPGHPENNFKFSSLRHLASVGEPLNPEPIRWGLKTFGLPFHDNWWQTETGGICIANYASMDIKFGSMGKPLPGIEAAIVDDEGKVLGPNQEGNLALKPGWPSMMKTIWRRPKKYDSYFLKGWYISGDRAFTDEDGYYWFIGRADDVIKTSG
jgi:acetyl-CoA synthetase